MKLHVVQIWRERRQHQQNMGPIQKRGFFILFCVSFYRAKPRLFGCIMIGNGSFFALDFFAPVPKKRGD